MMQLAAQGPKPLLGLSLGLALAVGCGEPTERDGLWSAEPITMDADVRVIASGGRGVGSILLLGANSSKLVADESGVYWYDWYGAVFGQRRGESEVVQLLAGVDELEESAALTMGIASSVDRLFVADAHSTPSFDYVSALPPGRVWSVPKDGAAPSVWLESDDEVLVPLTVQGDHLFLLGLGDSATSRYYRANLNGGALEPTELTVDFLENNVTGTAFYWPERRNPLRVRLHDRPSVQVTRMNAQMYKTCPGYFVSRFVQTPTVLIHRAESEYADSLPPFAGLGASTACDAQYAYFYGSPGPDAPVENGHIVRVDVASGQLTNLVSPGMPLSNASFDTDIAGEDAENIYIVSEDRVLAVRKP